MNYFRALAYTCLIYVLCSTSSIAQQTVGLFQYNEAKSFNGLTMFSPMGSKNTYLLNNCGKTVHTWKSTAPATFSVYLLNDGSILRPEANNTLMHFNLGQSGGVIRRIAWDGSLIWSTTLGSDTDCPHHDIYPLPNGNILVIMWEIKTPDQVIAAGRPDSAAGECWTEKVVELKPIGNDKAEIVWEWHLWDHLVQYTSPFMPNYSHAAESPRRFDINAVVPPKTFADWVHLNGIDYDAERDEIVLSARSASEFWVIDHSTTTAEAASSSGGRSDHGGDFLYRWGNKHMYKQADLSQAQLGHQHNVKFIRSKETGALGFSVFNNDAGLTPTKFSSVDIIYPPMNSDGSYQLSESGFGPDTVDWRYMATPPDSMYSAIISSAQILPNSNILICEGTKGRFIEIDKNKEVVWKYVNPDVQGTAISQGVNPVNNSVFRCQRYPYNHPGFANKTFDEPVAIEKNPLPSNCLSSSIEDDHSRVIEATRTDQSDLGVCTGSTFKYQIDHSGFIQVRLFDIKGHCVAVLHDNHMDQGSYSYSFESSMAKGLYMLRIRSDEGIQNKKILYLGSEE